MLVFTPTMLGSAQQQGRPSHAKTENISANNSVAVQNEQRAIEPARKMYADNPASALVDDNLEEMRQVPPEEFIEDVQDALMLLFGANPLFEQAGAEVMNLSSPDGSESN